MKFHLEFKNLRWEGIQMGWEVIGLGLKNLIFLLFFFILSLNSHL